MESHVKERLTGALILVALLVVVVPEMLSGPAPRATGSDSAAAEGPPLRTYTMELGAPRDGVKADQSALAPQTGSANATVEPATSATPARETDPAAAVEPAREVLPPVAAEPQSRPPATTGSGWWVQIGSFSQVANADRITQQLAAAGFSAQVSPVRTNGKELFRVRAGPVGDRASAEALRNRLAAAGHKGSLVAP